MIVMRYADLLSSCFWWSLAILLMHLRSKILYKQGMGRVKMEHIQYKKKKTHMKFMEVEFHTGEKLKDYHCLLFIIISCFAPFLLLKLSFFDQHNLFWKVLSPLKCRFDGSGIFVDLGVLFWFWFFLLQFFKWLLFFLIAPQVLLFIN